MSDGDAGEDDAECAPDPAHLAEILRAGGGENDAGRKAVEREREITAYISVQTTRYVPERGSEHGAEEEIRSRDPDLAEGGIGRDAGNRHERGSGGYEVVEGRAVDVIAIADAEMALATGGGDAGDGFRAQGFGSSGDGAASPLLEAVVDAERVIGFGERAVDGLNADEPEALCEIEEKQGAGDPLWTANRVGIEKSA